MEIWLKKEGKEDSAVRIPVLPSSFELTKPWNHQTVEVNSIGTVNLLGKRGLLTIPISSFFPYHYNPTFCDVSEDELKSPYEYVSCIEALEGKICRLTITDTNINMLCLINSFTYSELDGSGDVTYTIELTEYRNVELSRASVKKTTKKTYTTKKKDTLGKIARKKLGSASKYNVIYNNNVKKCTKAWKKKTYAAKNKKKAKKNKLFVKGIKLVIPK